LRSVNLTVHAEDIQNETYAAFLFQASRASMSKRDFLVELGTEELPPKSLFALASAFADGIARELATRNVGHGELTWFATPRRLAVRVQRVVDRQPDQQIKRLGPAITQAFDASGQPTKAALGFAASCGTTLEALEQVEGPKGRVLQFVGKKAGAQTTDLLADVVKGSLAALPIARRMRWGAGEDEFVRPVHWVVMLFGSSVIDAQILGVRTGKQTRGHRFHAPGSLAIRSPASYCETLFERGRVVADVNERRERIRQGVTELARTLGGVAVIEAALLDEVTALVEWPVPIAGRFDARYLELPAEVPIATMQDHQRYFPVRDPHGRLMNNFITVANIESRDPDKVRDGNERVVRPRLADAAFFWETDRKQPLASRRDALRSVIFQNQLGSLLDKSERVAQLAVKIAHSIGADVSISQRAAQLSKCDLLTSLVGEFPELQGTMGKYYAQHDGEPAELCRAIEEQYLPRFAGDRLPETPAGRALALADKLDSIAGTFCIGQKPSGTRDPYGLRRAALGVLRITMESRLELDLRQLVMFAVELQPVAAPQNVVEEIWTYIAERLRGSYLERAASVTTEMFDAVLAVDTSSPVDIDARLQGLTGFLALPESASLAAANKRIANILRKSPDEAPSVVNAERLREPAEQQLFKHVSALEGAVEPLFAARNYEAGLTRLAPLKDDVDRFFDTVMVMVEDPVLRANRLALLAKVRSLFLRVADLSKLPG
jgi:glycyl-tRNA synthetase beta chain